MCKFRTLTPFLKKPWMITSQKWKFDPTQRKQQQLTCSISSLIMPFHWPFSSGEPYFPSGTRRISYEKPRMFASSLSKSMQKPSKRSFPTSALSDFLSMTYGSSCKDPKDQMKSNGEVSFFNLSQHMHLIEPK